MGLVVIPVTLTYTKVPSETEWQSLFTVIYNVVNGNLDAANVDTTAIATLTLAQTFTGIKTFTAQVNFQGTYTNYILIGTARLWYDTTDECFRVKHGSDPSSISDGNPLMEG